MKNKASLKTNHPFPIAARRLLPRAGASCAIQLAAALLCLPSAAPSARAASQAERGPRLFFTPAMIERMRQKTRDYPWARRAYQNLKARADAWVRRTDTPPEKGGGWYHNYTCPDCGGRLRFRKDHPHEHLCPRCGKVWRGEKYDAVWRSAMHSAFIAGARDMGLMWRLTGRRQYAEAAIRILRWYAEHYADFPPGPGPAGRGRVQAQSLTECTWLLQVMSAADLVRNAMDPETDRRVAEDLIRAGANWIRKFRFGIHNIQCWHNACYAAAGYYLGDRKMVLEAREGPLGFREQIEKGILSDGFWFERSLGYHEYTLSALIAHCEVARNAGEPLDTLGRLPAMFTAPLRLAFPNLAPPSLNDMGYATSRINPRPLEIAAAWHKDRLAARALRRLLDLGASRANLTAWKYGEKLPDLGPYRPPGSLNLEGMGLAVLRRGAGARALCAMLEYGEHGGGHGHPDKLQLIVYGLGRPLCPDLGTTAYGNPMHKGWYKTTPGHNTVVIDGRSMARKSGRLLCFQTGSDADAAVAAADAVYPGRRLTRKILLADRFLVDVFDVESETNAPPAVIDWFLRAPGKLALRIGGKPAGLRPLREKPLSRPYAYLENLRGFAPKGLWEAVWTVDPAQGARLRLVVLGAEEPTQAACADAPGPPGTRWPTLRIRRAKARSTRFLTVCQFLSDGEEPEEVQGPFSLPGKGDALRVGGRRVLLPERREAPLRLLP